MSFQGPPQPCATALVDPAEAVKTLHPLQVETVREVDGLVAWINANLKAAIRANTPLAKVEALGGAKTALAKVRRIAEANPWIVFNTIQAVEAEVAKLNAEFTGAGFYAYAAISAAGRSPRPRASQG